MTLMMSELGFVYFLGSTEARKAVMVYSISLVFFEEGHILHQEHAHLLEHFLL